MFGFPNVTAMRNGLNSTSILGHSSITPLEGDMRHLSSPTNPKLSSTCLLHLDRGSSGPASSRSAEAGLLGRLPVHECVRSFIPDQSAPVCGPTLSAQDGPEGSGPVLYPRYRPGRTVRGIHRHRQPESQVRGQPDRGGPLRPEGPRALLTCRRAEQAVVQPEGLRGRPVPPGGGRPPPRGPGGGLLLSLLLPAEEAVDELRRGAAARGAALQGRVAPGSARQPGGGGEMGASDQRARRTAAAPRTRWADGFLKLKSYVCFRFMWCLFGLGVTCGPRVLVC